MRKKLLFIVAIFFLLYSNVSAQETADSTNNQNFSLSVDIVTNYVWRGLVYSDAPNLQPYLAFTNNKGNFSAGAWGSYSLSDYYSEVDLFVSYTISNFTIAVWDYFGMSQTPNNRYFDYKNSSTNHAFEGMITFNGPESFPIQIIGSTFFYGNDKDAQGDNYYSTYFEALYPFSWKANNLSVFAGITPMEGLYATEFEMVNLGISNSRAININKKFAIPITGTVIVNPNLENIYFVLAINLSANN